MGNLRRHKPRNSFNSYNNTNHHQRFTTMTQHSSKPPLANYKHSVPAWEKDFCAMVGSVPWWKVLEAKRFMHLYDRVVQWDDSAGEDAFKNAKSRFWAEINGFPCDLSSPDPDAYIDDVDWDVEDDIELILDLERPGLDPVIEEEGEHVVVLDALVLSGQCSGGLGWGVGWGDAEGVNEEGKLENSWEDSWGIKEKTGSWDQNNNSFRNEPWDHNKNSNSFNRKNGEKWYCKDQGRESREWRKKGEVQHGGDRVEYCRWRNRRGRGRGGFQQQSNGWGWTESF